MEGVYLFSVAADRQDLIDTVDSFNVTLSWSFGVLWVGLVLAVFIQVRFGSVCCRFSVCANRSPIFAKAVPKG